MGIFLNCFAGVVAVVLLFLSSISFTTMAAAIAENFTVTIVPRQLQSVAVSLPPPYFLHRSQMLKKEKKRNCSLRCEAASKNLNIVNKIKSKNSNLIAIEQLKASDSIVSSFF